LLRRADLERRDAESAVRAKQELLVGIADGSTAIIYPEFRS
jgi:hypothetical protein